RENLAVFSAQPMDEAYQALRRATQPALSSGRYTVDGLLRGEGGRKGTIRDENLVTLQTEVLLMKAIERESELATVSHEGTRQLMAAGGKLPRNVQIPQWIDHGLASFFETPRTVEATVGSYWPGSGAVLLPYLIRFKTWERTKNKKFERNPAEGLKAV